MSDFYNKIKIKTIWLTDSGLEAGNPCKTSVKGLERLKLTKTGTTRPNADGSPVVQLVDVRGAKIVISSPVMEKTIFDSIIAICEQFIADGLSFDLSVEGDTGDFSDTEILSVIPDFPDPVKFSGEFIAGLIKDVEISLRVT